MKIRKLARPPRFTAPRAPRPKRRPHETLSVQQLRRRLYQGGARSADASRIAKEIKAGPASIDELLGRGYVTLGWPKEALVARYGQRLTRAITKFVRRSFFIPDEYHQLAASQEFATGLAEFAGRVRLRGRKENFRPFIVEQSFEQLGLPAGVSHSVVSAPSREGASMLTWLSDEDAAALSEWRSAQPGDPNRAGAVDLMQWPGWAGVALRRSKGRAVVLHGGKA